MKSVRFSGLEPELQRECERAVSDCGLRCVGPSQCRNDPRVDLEVHRLRQRDRGLAAPVRRAERCVLVVDSEVVTSRAHELSALPGTALLELAAHTELGDWASSAARQLARLLVSDAWRPVGGIVGKSAAAGSLRAALHRASRTRSTVLLTGETGTGKTLAAAAIHALTADARPFIHVDCAALSPALLESELFGHERGAFTGAASRRSGRFELTQGGTLLLDEVGELEPRLQAKLLRVLEEREFERVGGSRPLRFEGRVIAASNVPLLRAVEEGRFRSDLFYRLDVLRIAVPELSRRRADVPLLAAAGLDRICKRLGVPLPALTEELLSELTRREWPGNVRELLNALERLVVNSPAGRLDCNELRAPTRSLEPPRRKLRMARRAQTADDDRLKVAEALVASGGNIARAARRLGIPRTTIQHRIERFGLRHLIPLD